MCVKTDRRSHWRDRLKLPIQMSWVANQQKNSFAWMLNASPGGLLLELPNLTSLTSSSQIDLNLQLTEKLCFGLGLSTVCHITCRRNHQLIGLRLHKEYPFLFCPSMLGFSPRALEVKALIAQIGSADLNILIYGETGTGKNVLAKTLHDLYRGEQEPFIRVNCPSIPDALFESELFGHEKGSFTDARSATPGFFRLAAGGTILLDEITEMESHLQAKLLRVIEDKAFMPVGGQKFVPVRAKIIATTNLDPEQAVERGRLRRDLWYRLCEMPIYLSPLRERQEDVALLARHFLTQYCEKFGRSCRDLSQAEIDVLENYYWPGNIRELENFMKQSAALGKFVGPRNALQQGRADDVASLNGVCFSDPLLGNGCSLSEVTKKMTEKIESSIISRTLQECGDNRTHAALRLGISYRTLLRKLEYYKHTCLN